MLSEESSDSIGQEDIFAGANEMQLNDSESDFYPDQDQDWNPMHSNVSPRELRDTKMSVALFGSLTVSDRVQFFGSITVNNSSHDEQSAPKIALVEDDFVVATEESV